MQKKQQIISFGEVWCVYVCMFFFFLLVMLNCAVFYFTLRDTDIFHKCGRDAVQYLSFQRHLLVYVTVITVISVGVVLPVNFQGNLRELLKYFALFYVV